MAKCVGIISCLAEGAKAYVPPEALVARDCSFFLVREGNVYRFLSEGCRESCKLNTCNADPPKCAVVRVLIEHNPKGAQIIIREVDGGIAMAEFPPPDPEAATPDWRSLARRRGR